MCMGISLLPYASYSTHQMNLYHLYYHPYFICIITQDFISIVDKNFGILNSKNFSRSEMILH